MPTQICLAVVIARIIVVVLVIGSVVSQETGSDFSGDSEILQPSTTVSSEPLSSEQTTFHVPDVTSNEAVAPSSDLVRVVSTLLSTSPGSFISEPSLSQDFSTAVNVTTDIAIERTATTTRPLVAPTLFTPLSQSSSFNRIPSVSSQRVVSATALSTSVFSSSLVLAVPTGTVVATSANRPPIIASVSPIPVVTTTISMPILTQSFTFSSTMQLPTESPGTDDSGDDSGTSFWLYVAIPIGSVAFCALFVLFACLVCIWFKRIIRIKVDTASKRGEEGDTRGMFVLENASSKGDSLRYDIPNESTNTFRVTSLTTQCSEQTPGTLVTQNRSTSISDGGDENLSAAVVVANPAMQWGPEVNTNYRINRIGSLPRSYQMSTNRAAHSESQNPPVLIKPARSLGSIYTRECEGKRQLSSSLFGNADTQSKVCTVPTTTHGLKDQQPIGGSEELKHTQHPRRTTSANALHTNTNAELANQTLKENEGLYDVPRRVLLRRASDSACSLNAAGARSQIQRTDSEPSSHYDTPRRAIAQAKRVQETRQQHPPVSQSSNEHASAVTTSSGLDHYDIPKKALASHSFSSKGEYRVNPQTAIQRHPSYPKAEPMPISSDVPLPKIQADVGPFSTYDVPRKAATLPHSTHINAPGDTSLYDVPRRLTAQNSVENFSGMMHNGPRTAPSRGYTMPRASDHSDSQYLHLPTSWGDSELESVNVSAHGYQTVRRPAEDIADQDSDSSCGSEHFYDLPPPEEIEEMRRARIAKKIETSDSATVVLSPPPNVAPKNAGTSANTRMKKKAPPPIKQKPVLKSTATKQL